MQILAMLHEICLSLEPDSAAVSLAPKWGETVHCCGPSSVYTHCHLSDVHRIILSKSKLLNCVRVSTYSLQYKYPEMEPYAWVWLMVS